jgi:hypothetical protein
MINPQKHTLKQITAAWRAQVRAAADQPWLFTLLMQPWERLFRCFAHFYQQLLALPRPHKHALKRRLATTLAGAALLLALGQALPARAAVITVDGVTCTLVESIASANNDDAAGNGCLDGNGADVIDLQTDVLLPTPLPQITSEITLEGNGHAIDGNKAFRVLNVLITGDLKLNNATITGGDAYFDNGGGIYNSGTLTVNDSTLQDNSAGYYGGGIWNSGTLIVNNSTLSGNSANSGGGGIVNVGKLTVDNSTLSNNSATSGDGGGIVNVSILMLNNSTLSGNSATCTSFGCGSGGGIRNLGTLILNDSSLNGNSATCTSFGCGNGGGIYNAGTLEVNNSAFSGNVAPFGLGGGIRNNGSLLVHNSTLSGNSAKGGSGIASYFGTATVNNSTVSGNSTSNRVVASVTMVRLW